MYLTRKIETSVMECLFVYSSHLREYEPFSTVAHIHVCNAQITISVHKY